jgi:hypothetical protein
VLHVGGGLTFPAVVDAEARKPRRPLHRRKRRPVKSSRQRPDEDPPRRQAREAREGRKRLHGAEAACCHGDDHRARDPRLRLAALNDHPAGRSLHARRRRVPCRRLRGRRTGEQVGEDAKAGSNSAESGHQGDLRAATPETSLSAYPRELSGSPLTFSGTRASSRACPLVRILCGA